MKKLIIITIFLFVISSAIVNAQLADSSWPMYHGGIKHGGLSSVDTSHVDGTVLWTFETGGGIESSPTIGSDGTIYVGSHDNKLYAINPDGTKKWEFYVGEPVHHGEFDVWKGILSTPAVDKDGTIYFSSLSDYFFALNPDGTEKWKYKLPFTADTWSSPAIANDGTIYTGSARRYDENEEGESDKDLGEMFAFNPDGTLKWHFALFNADMSASPAIAEDGTVYSSTYNMVGNVQDGWIVAVNPDGTEKWRFKFPRFTESSPTIGSDGTVYFGTIDGLIIAINSDGTEKWSYQTDDGVSSIPAIGADNTIYVGSWDGFFYALNPDGSLKWKFETLREGESITSSAAIGADGTIYVGARDGFRAINPDGTSKWHYEGKLGGVVSAPAIGKDGTVYVGSWDKNLYAFGGSTEKDNETTTVNETTAEDQEHLTSRPLVDETPTVYLAAIIIIAVVASIFILKKRLK
jgi:outer membrane protein assembly factor BamB